MAEKLETRSELFKAKDISNPDNATPGFHISTNKTNSGISMMLTVENVGNTVGIVKYYQFDLCNGSYRIKRSDALGGGWEDWSNS